MTKQNFCAYGFEEDKRNSGLDRIASGTCWASLAQPTAGSFPAPRVVFASYNAGPNRIARLRKLAASEGLDPNKWFGNVELVVAKGIGQETVQYVNNIYKYYIAYKLTLEQSATKN